METMKVLIDGKGFTLLELVVVIAVLSILSAISWPSFLCFVKSAQIEAAISQLVIKRKECLVSNSATESDPIGYTMNPSGRPLCEGDENGNIVVVPNYSQDLPSIFINLASNRFGYSYKGITGSDMQECRSTACDSPKEIIRRRIASEEFSDFVVPGLTAEFGCSLYAVVEGPSWQQAENNAKKLGGNLAGSNSEEELEWIEKEFSDLKYAYEGDQNPGDPEEWIIFWLGGQYNAEKSSWEWTSGGDWIDGVKATDPGIGNGLGTDNINPLDRQNMTAHFNHDRNANQFTRHGDGDGTMYLNATNGNLFNEGMRGIAEIPTCN